MTCILTNGTLTDPSLLSSDQATYCMAIKQSSAKHGQVSYGVALVDAATSEFRLGYIFQENSRFSAIETALLHVKPKEIIVEKNQLSGDFLRLLKSAAPLASVVQLAPTSEFWSSRKTWSELEQLGHENNGKVPLRAFCFYPLSLSSCRSSQTI